MFTSLFMCLSSILVNLLLINGANENDCGWAYQVGDGSCDPSSTLVTLGTGVESLNDCLELCEDSQLRGCSYSTSNVCYGNDDCTSFSRFNGDSYLYNCFEFPGDDEDTTTTQPDGTNSPTEEPTSEPRILP